MTAAEERFSSVPDRVVLGCDYVADPLWATTSGGETFMVELKPLPSSDRISANDNQDVISADWVRDCRIL